MSTTLVTIILGALGSIIAAELLGWCPLLAKHLIRLAVSRLPQRHRARYQEEWLADMDMLRTRGGLSTLLWAAGVYVMAHRVASALQRTIPKEDNRHRHVTLAEAARATNFAINR